MVQSKARLFHRVSHGHGLEVASMVGDARLTFDERVIRSY